MPTRSVLDDVVLVRPFQQCHRRSVNTLPLVRPRLDEGGKVTGGKGVHDNPVIAFQGLRHLKSDLEIKFLRHVGCEIPNHRRPRLFDPLDGQPVLHFVSERRHEFSEWNRHRRLNGGVVLLFALLQCWY
jgi:hypothetical protein